MTGPILSLLSVSCLLLAILETGSASPGDYYQSERCSDAQCRAAPRGTFCQEKYNRKDDGCCPEWRCDNGQTIYGVRRSSSNSFTDSNNGNWQTSWKSSWLSGDKFDSSLGQGNRNSLFDREDQFFGKPNRDSLFDRYWRRR